MNFRSILVLGILFNCAFAGVARAADEQQKAREQLNSVIWFQTSNEATGNSIAVYRAAKAQLPKLRGWRNRTSADVEQLATDRGYRKKPAAIVIDIDETVLDNSPYNALLVRDRQDYDVDGYKWADWVKSKSATGMPGAKDFVSEARRLGYHVIFVTNRQCNATGTFDANGESTDCPQEAHTQENLSKVLDYVPADAEMYLRYEREDRLAEDKLDKQQRRKEIAEKYRIAMLVGDDLNDFIRDAEYDASEHEDHWGKDWFALANPMYGSWERKFKTLDEKYAALRTWERASDTATDLQVGPTAAVSLLARMPVHLRSKSLEIAGIATSIRGTRATKKLPNAVTVERGLATSVTTGLAAPSTMTVLSVGDSPPDNLRVHIIPVGAGSCSVIECPGSADVIINDCGQKGGSPNSWAIERIAKYVKSIVGGDKPAVVISHPDEDHYVYVPGIVEPANAEAVLFGGDESEFNDDMREWLGLVPDKRLRHGWESGFHEVVPELSCGTATVHMLTVNVPSQSSSSDKNANSLILGVQHGNHKVVFTGDAEGSTQDSAVSNDSAFLQGVTLLTASHHGAHTHKSNNSSWAQHVAPSVIVYSSGTSHGHPSATIVGNYQPSLLASREHPMWASPMKDNETRFESVQAEYVTEQNGLIVFESDGTSVGLVCEFQEDPCF